MAHGSYDVDSHISSPKILLQYTYSNTLLYLKLTHPPGKRVVKEPETAQLQHLLLEIFSSFTSLTDILQEVINDKENQQNLKMDGNFKSVKLLYEEVQNILKVRQAI